jgi:hypothetical protein
MDELAGTDWRREGERIVRDLAEEVNHRPDILVHGEEDRRARVAGVATIGPVA